MFLHHVAFTFYTPEYNMRIITQHIVYDKRRCGTVALIYQVNLFGGYCVHSYKSSIITAKVPSVFIAWPALISTSFQYCTPTVVLRGLI